MKHRHVFWLSALAAGLWLTQGEAKAQTPANPRGARGVRATAPPFNGSPTVQGHLDAAKTDLSQALAALQRATTANAALKDYGGHLPDATNDVQMALANLADADKYVAAHPEANTPASSTTWETLPNQPAVLQPANRVPGLNMLTAIDALNSALADLTKDPENPSTGIMLGDIGGYRANIIADIQQACTDVLACIDYSNQVQGNGRRGGVVINRGVAASRGAQRYTPAPTLHATAISQLDTTQYYLELALDTLHAATPGEFGGHTEQAMAAIKHAQADVLEANAYVKAHPESDPLPVRTSPPVVSSSRIIGAPSGGLIPPPPGGSLTALGKMQKSYESLNAALTPLTDDTSVFILGDIGGCKAKLVDDINQALKEVQAGLDYANSAH